ncbi:MAG TPA: hypothetical protein VFN71_14115 [Methylomirabilota bacterium]|nr:hypothetical protein [Methylomirabilota bacterium]
MRAWPKVALVVVTLLAGAAGAGCEVLWNLGNKYFLKGHMAELFGRSGLTADDLDCNMIGATRGATCLTRLGPQQVAHLTRGLGLKEDAPTASGPWAAEHGCRGQRGFEPGAPVTVYASGAGAKDSTLRLKDGTAFTYLVVFARSDSDAACIQVSYAYG